MNLRSSSPSPEREPRPARAAGLSADPATAGSQAPSNAAPRVPTTSPPTISLPKGGGAIRGIGEKLAANPVTGTASMTVPIATSPGRSGFGPHLALSYDSGAGNGPFGFGWSFQSPAITRKTDKGLPRYRDSGEDADVYVLSGAEDLVPVLTADGSLFEDTSSAPGFTIHRYRPRIEGLFARIERWTRDDGDIHWRSISKDNVLTVYGKDASSRIADPDDARRVFSWLISESRDDKGNAIRYEYKAEDGAGVDLTRVHERNRGDRDDPRRAVNRYLKHIRYGNRVPLLDSDTGRRPRDLTAEQVDNADWMFEVVFDYGDHAGEAPTPAESRAWSFRNDPFSSYRAGFEVRTCRLCQRVLMFHHFADEPGVGVDCLVRSTDFTYSYEEDPDSARNPIYSFLRAVTQTGYTRAGDGYLQRSLPPVELGYSEPVVQDRLESVDPASLENLPIGLDGAVYQWTDLHGEGISGILTEQAEAWYYKRNLSPLGNRTVEFAPLERVATKPNLALAGGARFMDLAGDGRPDVVLLDGPTPGLFEHDGREGWQPFRPFTSRLNRDTGDPNLRFVDLDGDGHADVLITEDDALVWHPSLGEEGFDEARRIAQAVDEEKGPRLVFADGTSSIYLADLSGDGLSDLARIKNGEICYWPNQGYGRFGAKVTMDRAPHFDHPDQFDQRRVLLADIDGSGTTDVIYLHRDGVRLYFNQSGNSWSEPKVLAASPRVDDLVNVAAVDLLGNGTACLVWSSPLPGDAGRPMRYVDLMGGQKPHLLTSVITNMGLETHVEYAPSTRFYLEDKRAGTPWATRLPFPVHVVERVETHDLIAETRLVSTYRYRHGYFDGEEREFRGFGCVEQRDAESFSRFAGLGDFSETPDAVEEEFHLPPVLVRSWFHTGAYLEGQSLSRQYIDEYYDGDADAVLLPDTVLPEGLSVEEEREAARALKGLLLRQEVYALDDTEASAAPYTVAETAFNLRRLQPRHNGQHAAFYPYQCESLTYHYERNPADPRIAHALTLEVDDFGNVTRSAAIGYPRRSPAYDEQAPTLATYTAAEVVNRPDEADSYRVGVPFETRTYELTGLTATGDAPTRIEEMLELVDGAREVPYEAPPTEGIVERRLIELGQTLYYRDDLGGPLPLGQVDSLALPFESYALALTPGLVEQVYGARVADPVPLLQEGRYVEREIEPGGESGWWVPSGRLVFEPDRFFLPVRSIDPFGETVEITYDPHNLAVARTEDPLGNVVEAAIDYRTLQPFEVTDPNGNRSQVAFDELGLVVATAVMGKVTETLGDSLEGLDPHLDTETIRHYLDDPLGIADDAEPPQAILGNATSRLVYDLDRYADLGEPPVVATLARETHAADLAPGEETRIQHTFLYTDGSGREIMTKVRAEPGPISCLGIAEDVSPRWTGTGRTVYDNKGNPVKQYEPFFSPSHRFETEEELVECGVTPILRYDPLGRLVRTDFPDGTLTRVVFDPWRQETWDPNDTVLESEWLVERQGLPAGDPARRAAELASAHAETPMVVHFDTLGRTFLTVADNGPEGQYETRVRLDVEGNVLATTDARGRVVETNTFDVSGSTVHTVSMDGGARTLLVNVAGNPIRAWDARGHSFRTVYDALRRPTHRFVQAEGGDRVLLERSVYGEGHPDAAALNLRGQVFLLCDGAGVVRSVTRDPETGRDVAFDFKGNPLGSERRLAVVFEERPDWTGVDSALSADPWNGVFLDLAAIEAALSPRIESETFAGRTRYDALNRPILTVTPDASVTRPSYNEANLLERMDVLLRGAADPTTFVENIDYNARGQRTRIDYGNGVWTTYSYDEATFRLSRLLTERAGGARLQDLTYTYDPSGNMTEVRDAAQPEIFFANSVVSADNRYVYDALYRLIEATGREHIGQGANDQPVHRPDLKPHYDFNDITRRNLAHPHDGQAMRRYTRRYVYDAVGNFLQVIHQANGGSFTRRYAYQAASEIDAGQNSNRLTNTSLPGDPDDGPFSAQYMYDVHGNMTRMPHLGQIDWDADDQMRRADLGGGGTAFYNYDAGGERVRKVVERLGSVREERLYLGGFEIFRRRRNDATELERETLHVMDDRERVALVEMLTIENSAIRMPPTTRQRCQLDNHLGSAVLELAENGAVISYEEFHPFGTTSYNAQDSAIEDNAKRYRYIGKERDEETGLYYCGARYYATWLGRWTAVDPMGLVDGPGRYSYARANPVRFKDTGGMETKSGDQEVYGVLPDPNRYRPPRQNPTEPDTDDDRWSGLGDKPVFTTANPSGKGSNRPPPALHSGVPKRIQAAVANREVAAGHYKFKRGDAVTHLWVRFDDSGTMEAMSWVDLPESREAIEARYGTSGRRTTILQHTFSQINRRTSELVGEGLHPRAAGWVAAQEGVAELKSVVGASLAILEGASGVGSVGLMSPRSGTGTPKPGGATWRGRARARFRAPPKRFENQIPADVPRKPVTRTREQLLAAENKFIYVVKADGSLVIGPRKVGNVRQYHIDLAGGEPVLAAGEGTLLKGRAHEINNLSGHYQPSGPSAREEALRAFERYGWEPNRYKELRF